MAIAGDTGIVNARILSNGDGHVFAVGFVPSRDAPRVVEIFCLLQVSLNRGSMSGGLPAARCR